MNKFLKGVLVITLSFISFNNQAQIVALKGGLNLSNMDSDLGLSSTSALGLHLGVTFDIPLTEMFAIETGLFGTTKGAKYELNLFGFKSTSTINLLYAEIPLYFKTIFALNDDIDIYAKAGGYLAVGIIGVNRSRVEFLGEVETDEEEINFDNDGLERLDYGLTFGLGTELKGFIVEASYDLGLANISDDDLITIQNRVIKITLGYRFGWDN